ncbi:hypothetical protein GWK75_00370 [Candidatus Saccharibacteria bacterium oral taxon 955]|jgi:hypothetical protein cdivTM_02431|nr:hypothetical protein GWK75_00370 [Candidatus Saccharibacteria bacterium oral taxon 955]
MAESNVVKQIVDKIKDSSNILVTVNTNPSVDELSAALGVTLAINKLNKHATAVFSGEIPPAIEFLNPEKTFENTVDSLRDFIIALDKEKADHLRYKVVDDMVKIFITPYRTTINENDLDFSQGDYNVETVLAIGVKTEADLDRALESHGRILHDATVAAISLGEPTNLGGIEWADKNASSYSEMLYMLADSLKTDRNIIDEQIATAFLTGIVASTDRFSNANTSSKVMTVAAQLMSAGANQQLIATKLEEEHKISSSADGSDGELKEGESKKIESPKKTPKKKAQESDGAIGALSISHVPEGSLDEVTRKIGEKKSNEALNTTEEALARRTSEIATSRQEDAAKLAETKLVEQLAASQQLPQVPSVEAIQRDIANARPDGSVPTSVMPPVVHGAVATDQLRKVRTDEKAEEPSLGGTLNATTEQAEEDKRRQIEDDRNRTILTHGTPYTSAAPAFQSPLNATTAMQQDAEPKVRDIFAENSQTSPTDHGATVQPTVPVAPAPTLAEIDAKNRTDYTEARAAIDAALNTAPAPGDTAQAGLPPLPPLPPMPDFSTLPPLPGGGAPATTSVPDTLGDVLPPAPVDATVPQAQAVSSDPSQFRIPGQ